MPPNALRYVRVCVCVCVLYVCVCCVCELNACGWSLVVLERPEVEDRRPLFERLREQKDRKQMEWDEQLKLSELALGPVYLTLFLGVLVLVSVPTH